MFAGLDLSSAIRTYGYLPESTPIARCTIRNGLTGLRAYGPMTAMTAIDFPGTSADTASRQSCRRKDIMEGFMPSYVYSDNPDTKVQAPKPVPEGMTECDGCNGSGVYYGRGSVVNGHFVGFKGTCYRCGGKGHQTPKDVKRNAYYDNHVRRITL